jgi:uncharacterized UBP type Zn finger protein
VFLLSSYIGNDKCEISVDGDRLRILWTDRNVWSFDMEEAMSLYSRDHKFDASLSSQSVSLDDCLAFHLEEEEIEDWHCPRCKKKGPGVKKLDILSLPRILIIHFKRFSYAGESEKIDTIVEFPLQWKGYTLIGVSEHRGRTLSNGHYTAYGKVGEEWVWFNDGASMERGVESESAYVLFYERKEGWEKNYEE